MKRTQLTCLLAFIVAVLGGAGDIRAANTFYVGPRGSDRTGDGSPNRPWATIRHATDTVPDDGSTILLMDGLYMGTQSVNRHFRKQCVVRAMNPYRARFRGLPSANRVFYCYDGSNVKIQGLEIFGSGGTASEYLIHVSRPQTHHLIFQDCIVHDCYTNDTIKINAFAHHIVFSGCVFANPENRPGREHFDVNMVTDVTIEDSIFFNDFAGSGRPAANNSHSFIVIKNSGRTPNVTQRITLRRNVFLNWEGLPDQAYVLLGEDGKPFMEAQQVLIENNLFIFNSPNPFWGAFLLKGGLQDVAIRANTVVGHPVHGKTGRFAGLLLRIEQNPPMGNMRMCNNIWCDPSGRMPRFCYGPADLFAPGSRQTMRNNLFWNGGQPVPSEQRHVFDPAHDPAGRTADPQLADPSQGVVLPRWDPARAKFLSSETTIRGEFTRLVNAYAALGAGSAAIDAAEAMNMPDHDILGRSRDAKPDIGCFEKGAK